MISADNKSIIADRVVLSYLKACIKNVNNRLWHINYLGPDEKITLTVTEYTDPKWAHDINHCNLIATGSLFVFQNHKNSIEFELPTNFYRSVAFDSMSTKVISGYLIKSISLVNSSIVIILKQVIVWIQLFISKIIH